MEKKYIFCKVGVRAFQPAISRFFDSHQAKPKIKIHFFEIGPRAFKLTVSHFFDLHQVKPKKNTFFQN
jgi:hypothetical protein